MNKVKLWLFWVPKTLIFNKILKIEWCIFNFLKIKWCNCTTLTAFNRGTIFCPSKFYKVANSVLIKYSEQGIKLQDCLKRHSTHAKLSHVKSNSRRIKNQSFINQNHVFLLCRRSRPGRTGKQESSVCYLLQYKRGGCLILGSAG